MIVDINHTPLGHVRTPVLLLTGWSAGGFAVEAVQTARWSSCLRLSRPAPHVLEAVLERLTYVNEETGYTVARVATGRGSDLLTVVGALLGAQPGESLRLQGWWSSHPQYGRQSVPLCRGIPRR
jgi:hypothetical protein